jgi:hypothetical protein
MDTTKACPCTTPFNLWAIHAGPAVMRMSPGHLGAQTTLPLIATPAQMCGSPARGNSLHPVSPNNELIYIDARALNDEAASPLRGSPPNTRGASARSKGIQPQCRHLKQPECVFQRNPRARSLEIGCTLIPRPGPLATICNLKVPIFPQRMLQPVLHSHACGCHDDGLPCPCPISSGRDSGLPSGRRRF